MELALFADAKYSAQQPATRKPTPAHPAIRYFMLPLLPFSAPVV